MIRHDNDDARSVTRVDRQRWCSCLDGLTVFRGCGCGLCPSVDFAYKGAPVECGNRIILNAYTDDNILVLLFIDND
ncbi:hypothetical protein HMPREF0298_0948 [Corynebacterium lipophiloflavum DSM 44291]|uniref:Uncharacterized protein n=2 Tax=Corynebacterium TaxID=1716 RepID=C0XR78_CORLD|nr:hypothetical protein HMPREF0298_0948 [Corynebacterium lipophiloflavum DSM 44291]